MNKKNLDKLFQEKLKDFRQIPDEKVWKSIERSLDQRNKTRRVVPLWWKLGGAAAILAIALMVFGPFGAEDLPESSVTEVENADTPVQKDDAGKATDTPFIEDTVEEGVVATPERESRNSGMEDGGLSQPASVENSIVDRSEEKREPGSISEPEVERIDPARVAVNQAEDRNIDGPASIEEQISKEAAVVQNEKDVQKEKIVEEKAGYDSGNELQQQKDSEAYEEAVAAVSPEETDDKTEAESEKRSIFEEIEKQEEEALIAANEGSKWSLGAVVAPVYFGSLGEGSPIHSNFVSNTKSGNVNLSYGLAVGYKISDKLSLRSGLNKVDYGYDTNDISFSSSLVASTSTQITNINYTNTSRTLVVESNSLPENTQEFAANDIIAESPSRNGTMIQEFGYLEVPMELNYALLDRKLNIDLIGGISSLFLVNNSVVLESSGTSTEMGEANNLNDVNFSTNLGLGINYEFTDKVKVHLEPVFKFQLNTFSEVEGNFQPYTMGIYTGMSYKF